MKKLVLLLLVSCFVNQGLFAQLPILVYDFEDNVTRTTFQNQADQKINSVASEIVTSANTSFSDSIGFGLLYQGAVPGSTVPGRCIKGIGWQNVNQDPGTSPTRATTVTHYMEFSVNTSGFSGISLSFDLRTGPSNSTNPKLGVLISYDGGTTWSQYLGSANYPNANNYYTYPPGTQMLAAADNNPNLKLRLYGHDNNITPDAYIAIDNLMIYAASTVAG